MNQKLKPSVLLAGLAATAAAIGAQTLPTPPEGDAVDTESSVVASLASWADFNRRVELTLTLEATPSNNVQVAFGIDRNHDEDLEPEETELVVGFDCGRWFMRDEKARAEQFEDEATTTNAVRHLFRLRQPRACADRWTMAKVTTRGVGSSNPTVVAESKDGFAVSIR